MSKLRMQWLLVIIAVEVAVILGLLIWAVTSTNHDSKTTTTTPPPASNEQTTYNLPKLALAPFASGLTAPVDIAASSDPNDKRLFVAEQPGILRTINADGVVESKPVLDLTSKVLNKEELGFLGIALHPKFSENGYIFVHYNDKNRNSIIARYTISKTTTQADPASEKILMKFQQPYDNHNGGSIKFGPDGFLYIAFGDGGNAGDPQNRAQNKNELFGKILRIDVDQGNPYAIPADNPFANGGGKPEIWLMGLRNPWRTSFDRKTHDFYIGDVGQGEYEEVDLLTNGSPGGINYGWRCYEGSKAFKTEGCQAANTYAAPILQYDHGEDRCSITGGFVYRGTRFPALVGNYIYADFCGGQLYYANKTGDSWTAVLGAATDSNLSTFGEDSGGELYAADLQKGVIYRVEDTAN